MARNSAILLATIPVVLLLGCGNSDNSLPGLGAGGNENVGGASATGGSSKSVNTTAASTGGNAPNTGGAPSAGGSNEVGGGPATGGANHTGGKAPTGGADNAGGSPTTGGSSTVSPSTGGKTSTGGAAAGGASATGGKATGGATGMATGGKPAGGAATGGGAAGGAGGCQKGQVKPSEVIFMGESFYAIDPQYIEKRIESNAQAAGALAAGAKYRNVAISAQPMSVVVGEYDTALKAGPVKVVIMDGGGIDCMTSACATCPDQFKTLLSKMATNGVQQVIYTRYPEPGNPPGSNATLKGNLDTLMPKMQPVCESATGLKCHWVDLRPVWVNGDTNDGLHPTQSGGNHVGDLIWSEMVKDCIAQ